MSHVSSSRSPRARRAALVLTLVVALGACSHNRQVPTDYGETIEKNFTEGCEEALTDRSGAGEALSADDAAAVCACTYESISDEQDGIPYEDLKEEIDSLEDAPGPLPEDVRQRVTACRSEAGLS